jgi:hypothetical protein
VGAGGAVTEGLAFVVSGVVGTSFLDGDGDSPVCEPLLSSVGVADVADGGVGGVVLTEDEDVDVILLEGLSGLSLPQAAVKVHTAAAARMLNPTELLRDV